MYKMEAEYENRYYYCSFFSLPAIKIVNPMPINDNTNKYV